MHNAGLYYEINFSFKVLSYTIKTIIFVENKHFCIYEQICQFKHCFMKNLLIIPVLLVFISLGVKSQEYNVSFTASGAATEIDSLMIKSLFDCSSLWINGGDTVRFFVPQEDPEPGYTDLYSSTNNKMTIFPNPMENQCYFSFYSLPDNNAEISVFDISGRLITNQLFEIGEGTHGFSMNNQGSGLFIISVRTQSHHYTGRVISNSEAAGDVNISYQSFAQQELPKTKSLKIKNILEIPFEQGDRFLIRAYAGEHIAMRTIIPVKDSVYTLNFIECVDADGNNYPVIRIGSQNWMAENLRATHFRNMDQIPTTDDILEDLTEMEQPVFQWMYDYEQAPAEISGRLYTWYAVNDHRNICPVGWAVPSDDEWSMLTQFLGGEDVSGAKLKDNCSGLWHYPNAGADNRTAYSAIPGGFRYAHGEFSNFGENAYLWSRTEANQNSAYVRYLFYDNETVYKGQNSKKHGFSIRCIKAGTASVITLQESDVDFESAILGGNVLNDGGEYVFDRGVFWGTHFDPSITGERVSEGEGIGMFNLLVDELNPATTYYFQAYAENNIGIVFGAVRSFVTDATVPGLTTETVTDITVNSALSGGFIYTNGGNPVSSRGVVWSSFVDFPNLTDNEGFTEDGTGSGNFTSILSGLNPGTTYNIRAYATNSVGTGYGNKLSFTTNPEIPDVETVEITDITDNSATVNSIVNNDNGAAVTSKGIVWSTVEMPDIADNEGITTDGSGIGDYQSLMNGLNPGVEYFVRAYATNSVGTAYGEQLSFTTEIILPEVQTNVVTDITASTALGGGEVITDGGSAVTTRGIVWSDTEYPDLDDNIDFTEDGVGIGSYISNIIDLEHVTTYYVRAYATNIVGTSYGDQMEFTTNPIIPVLTTTEISMITQTGAESGGDISYDGGAEIIVRGVVWGTETNPSVEENDGFTEDGDGDGSFVSILSGLTPGTEYFVRAYAENSAGIGYGNELIFTSVPAPCEGITSIEFADYEYNLVEIGYQCWFAENLRTYEFANGDIIQEITDNAEWSGLTDAATCWYQNDSAAFADPYGKLYNWHAVNDSRNICPEGWIVPSDEDWKELEMFLGMTQVQAEDNDWRGNDEGGKLKQTGITYWWTPNTGATNESGFNAVPGGFRFNISGTFGSMQESAYFWTSTQQGASNAWLRTLDYAREDIFRFNLSKKEGYAVRCIKE